MARGVLVVVAHPDDEALGCGATIARHALAGDEVHVVVMADGVTSRPDATEADLSRRAAAAREANEILGGASLTHEGMPDNRLDDLPLLWAVQAVERHLGRRAPQAVYTHHGGDVNVDHRVVHRAVVTACRPQPGQSVDELLFFEVPSSTEWQTDPGEAFWPNWFVDVADTLALKLRALSAYGEEMRPWPHARSLEAVEHLARWRGATVGFQAAEAFVLGRRLVISP